MNLPVFGIPVFGIPDFRIPGSGISASGRLPVWGFPYLRNPCLRNPCFRNSHLRNPCFRNSHLRNFSRIQAPLNQTPLRLPPTNGGVSNGGASRSGLVLPFLSFFRPFWDFPDFFGIFPIFPGTLRGFSRFVLFLFLGVLTAPTRNSPERVCDTTWTFPDKEWETPRFGKPPGLASPKGSDNFYARKLWADVSLPATRP